MTGFFEDGMYQRIDRELFIRMIGSNPPRTENDPAFEGGIVDIQLKIDGDWTIVHKIWDTELQNR